MSLTDLKCRALKPKEKSYKVSDGDGLYLEVSTNGAKYWRLKYHYGGKEKRISFGVYPEVSLSEARQKRQEAREELRNGRNPIQTRLESRQDEAYKSQQVFKEIALVWYSKQLKLWHPRYAQTILHRLEKYVFPSLGSLPINTVKPLTILNCLHKIEKTAPEMARRVKGYIHLICVYSITIGLIEQDPTYGLEHALDKYRKGHFASITLEELPKFIVDLHTYKARTTRQTFLAIRLMFLTFIRTSELIKANWPEIDYDAGLWAIPAHRMKKDRPHLVPLSRQALEVLTELRDINPYSEFIFPSIPRPKKHMSNGTILMALKRMGYKGKMTGHGFRSLAMGILKEKLGYSHDLVDKQLAHSPRSGNDRAYDRALYLPQRMEMMQRYADYLDTLLLELLREKLSTASEKFKTEDIS